MADNSNVASFLDYASKTELEKYLSMQNRIKRLTEFAKKKQQRGVTTRELIKGTFWIAWWTVFAAGMIAKERIERTQ